MSAETFFSSVVEIGIGIAGFAGIIAAVRQRDVSTWDPHQRVLLQMLFTACAAAIVFSLFPSVLREGGFVEATTWRIGSAAQIAWFIGAPAFRIYQTRQPGVRFVIARGVVLLAIPLVFLLTANLFLLCASWPYLLGIAAILVNAFVTFLTLLFGGWDVEHASVK